MFWNLSDRQCNLYQKSMTIDLAENYQYHFLDLI